MKKRMTKIGCILLACIILISILVYTPTVTLEKDYTTLDLSLTGNEFYLDEENYESEMEEVVQPYLEQYVQEGYSNPEEGIYNYYRSYLLEEDNGTIVISHGFTENVEKYNETIYYFLKSGYSVYAVDHREHGYSTRLVEDLSKVTTADFQDFVYDFAYFVENIVIEETGEEPLYLYAHSMGGAIGATVLEQYPDLFDKAILVSPMMEINLGMPSRVATIISNFMVAIGQGELYLPGHGVYESVQEDLDPNYISMIRYDYWYAQKDSDDYFQSNGGTYQWLKACMKGMKSLLKEENLEKITTPVLLFQAEEDTTVLPSGQNAFVNGVESAELILVEDTEHAMYQSSNETLIPYFNSVFAYLAE